MPKVEFHPDRTIFDTEDGLQVQLDDNNCVGNFHRTQTYMDRISILDPRDKEWWCWFRGFEPPHTFNTLEKAAKIAGTVIIQSLVPEDVRLQFEGRIILTDEMIEDFLDEQES